MVTETGGRGSSVPLTERFSINSSGSSFGTLSSITSSVIHDSLSVGEKEMVVLTVTKSEPAVERVSHTHT